MEFPTDFPSSDDDILDFNSRLRHDMVVNLVTDSDGNKSLPKDPDSIYAVRALLKDNDSTIFTKRRLSNEEANTANDAKAAELLEIMMGKTNTKDFKNTEQTGGVPDSSRELPEFDVPDAVTSAVGNDVDLDEITAKGRAHFKGE